jgi:hypothetical protein
MKLMAPESQSSGTAHDDDTVSVEAASSSMSRHVSK